MFSKIIAGLSMCALALMLTATPVKAASHEMTAPFGNADDLKDAQMLWFALNKYRLVGPNSLLSTPYEGIEPHGFVLETIQDTIVVDGNDRIVIVKRNYGPEGVEVSAVADDPWSFLKAYTVMVKREKGYDSENQDWFYVKYMVDGTVLKNPKGMSLAGRVGKGGDAGCLPCHKNADGDDFVYNHNRFSKEMMK
ncbi:MAG: hypothetical protein JKY27_09280 [Magnetovibrio sp.]|nr:hypothetical protein [Magnetovibrio sp.]